MLAKSTILSRSLNSSVWSGNVVTLVGGFLEVADVGRTDGGIASVLVYIEGTGSKSHLNVVQSPTFKNLLSKCLAHIPP